MPHCQFCNKLLPSPVRFCSTEHAALFHQVSDPVAWAHYQSRYAERRAVTVEGSKRKTGRRLAGNPVTQAGWDHHRFCVSSLIPLKDSVRGGQLSTRIPRRSVMRLKTSLCGAGAVLTALVTPVVEAQSDGLFTPINQPSLPPGTTLILNLCDATVVKEAAL